MPETTSSLVAVEPTPDPVVNVTIDVSEVKPAWYWINDASGHGSITATMVFVAFWVTTIAFIASIVDKVGPVSIRPFDIGACGAYFIPILTLYFGRKFTDAKLLNKG